MSRAHAVAWPQPAATERRVARDGGRCTFHEFAQWYSHEAWRHWREAACRPTRGDGLATEQPSNPSPSTPPPRDGFASGHPPNLALDPHSHGVVSAVDDARGAATESTASHTDRFSRGAGPDTVHAGQGARLLQSIL